MKNVCKELEKGFNTYIKIVNYMIKDVSYHELETHLYILPKVSLQKRRIIKKDQLYGITSQNWYTSYHMKKMASQGIPMSFTNMCYTGKCPSTKFPYLYVTSYTPDIVTHPDDEVILYNMC